MLPPFAIERVLLLLWHVLIPYTYKKLVARLKALAQAPAPGENGRGTPSFSFRTHLFSAENRLVPRWYERFSLSNLSSSQRRLIDQYLPQLVSFFGILQRVHVAMFYFSGSFYHISKRLVNIRYVRYLPRSVLFPLSLRSSTTPWTSNGPPTPSSASSSSPSSESPSSCSFASLSSKSSKEPRRPGIPPSLPSFPIPPLP